MTTSRAGESIPGGEATGSTAATSGVTRRTQSDRLIQPLPWRAEHGVSEYGGRITDANDFTVTNQVTDDEADFIVRAVNSHADLLAALKAIVNGATNTEPAVLVGSRHIDAGRAAIKKAEQP